MSMVLLRSPYAFTSVLVSVFYSNDDKEVSLVILNWTLYDGLIDTVFYSVAYLFRCLIGIETAVSVPL